MTAKIFVVTSGKGGVGKTTSAINLGAALNYLNQDVIVVDANLATPNIGLHLGAPIVPVTLNHVLCEKAGIGEAIYEHSSGMKILPSSLSLNEVKKTGYENFRETAKKLKRISDYVIIDTPAGLGGDVSEIINAGDEVIIITNPELPAVTDALKVSKIARELDKEIRGIIITRVKRVKSEMPSANIKEMIEAPIIGVVPEDIAIQQALVMKDAVFHTHPRSKPARAYKEIAARLIGKSYASARQQEALEKAGFFNRVMKALGMR